MVFEVNAVPLSLTLVRHHWRLDRAARAKRSLPPATLAHRELLFAIDPLDPLTVHLMALRRSSM